MATLYVAEFMDAGQGPNSPMGFVALQPPMAEYTIAIGGSSVQSAVFQPSTRLVRLHTDAICSVSFGANPTATATKARMAASTTEYYAVPVNAGFKVAVITNS